jgi:BirA family biotin operon repressor/biotin-[acetyl-CoA-carboxylase] ligase
MWLSSPGKNLTFSIVLKFDDIQSQNFNQSDINDIISLTIVELLSNYGINARIKYPNDIYVGDKKICGILIEHSLRGNKMVNSIIGVGLNVNQQQFDISLPNPTSMISETRSKEIDLPTLLEELLEIFIKYASHLFDSVSNT